MNAYDIFTWYFVFCHFLTIIVLQRTSVCNYDLKMTLGPLKQIYSIVLILYSLNIIHIAESFYDQRQFKQSVKVL